MLTLFFDQIFCIFYVYNFWDSRYRKKKKRASHKDLCPKVGGSLCLFIQPIGSKPLFFCCTKQRCERQKMTLSLCTQRGVNESIDRKCRPPCNVIKAEFIKTE